METIATRRTIPLADFGAYLRTGVVPQIDPLEVKYNIWHDILTGRFTFVGGGRPSGGWTGGGFTGGGGRFGGGGASGSWSVPARRPSRAAATERSRPAVGVPHVVTTHAAIVRAAVANGAVQSSPAPRRGPSPRSEGHSPSPHYRHVVSNGYDYAIDSDNRPRDVIGVVTLGSGRRSRAAQRNAGGADRLPTDDGGHYIAPRFNGPTEEFNHFAQDANFNRGRFRVLEDSWDKMTRSGTPVFVHLTAHYHGASRRPHSITVVWTVGGKKSIRNFTNGQEEERHGK